MFLVCRAAFRTWLTSPSVTGLYREPVGRGGGWMGKCSDSCYLFPPSVLCFHCRRVSVVCVCFVQRAREPEPRSAMFERCTNSCAGVVADWRIHTALERRTRCVIEGTIIGGSGILLYRDKRIGKEHWTRGRSSRRHGSGHKAAAV